MGFIAAVALTAGALTAAGDASAATSCAAADVRPAAAGDVAAARRAVLCLINADRRAHDRSPMRADAHLRRAAQRYADALDPAGPLVHGAGGTTPRSRIAASGYARTFVYAEALGRSKGVDATPAARVRGWLRSGTTRALLRAARFKDAGVGIAIDGEKVTFVVVVAAKLRQASTTRTASASAKRSSGSSSRSPKSSRS